VEATVVVVAPGRDAPAPWNERLRAERGSFKPLPQTGSAAVGRSFWDYFNRKARVLTGPEAAESSLSVITDPPLVLHLATHGFFLDGRAGGTDRPLTLAGLAPAGPTWASRASSARAIRMASSMPWRRRISTWRAPGW